MSNNKKRRVGVRTFHRYSPGAFITGLFSLAIVACLGGFVILPLFTFVRGDETTVFKGLDYILLGVRRFYSGVVGDRFNSFLSFFNTYEGDNQLLGMICQFHEYIEMGLVGLLAIVALLAFIEACLAVVWIIGGKISKPKTTLSLGWAMFIMFGLDIGFFYLYLTFYSQLLNASSETVSATFNIYALAPLGGIFVSLLIMGITYKICFKNRVFAEKKKIDKNKENQIQEEPQEEPRPQNNLNYQQQQPPVVAFNNTNVPEEVFLDEPEAAIEIPVGATEIADHAYAKNSGVCHVELPEGIIFIGGGAFANCHNLERISFPKSLQEIGYNAFFDTPKLKTINYAGTKEDWTRVKRGSNWLTHSGTTVIVTADGPITVNPAH